MGSFIKDTKYSYRLAMSTNGVYLDKIIDLNILKKFHFIDLSISSYDDTTYFNYAGVRLHNILDKNLESIFELLKENKMKFPVINAKIIINKVNYMYIDRIYKYLKKYDFNHIMLRLADNMVEDRDVELNEIELSQLKGYMDNNIFFTENHISFGKINKNRIEDAYKIPSCCWTTKMNFYCAIDTFGDVYLCCPTIGIKEYSIGNINEKTLSQVWNSDRHKKVKKKLNERMRKGQCDLSICRFNNYNLLIDKVYAGEININMQNENIDEYHGYFI